MTFVHEIHCCIVGNTKNGNNCNDYSCMLACLATQSCLTLCDPMDYSLSGFSDHKISQARILKWVAVSFSRASSRSRVETQVSCIASGFFYQMTIHRELIKSIIPDCDNVQKWKEWGSLMYAHLEQCLILFRWVGPDAEMWVIYDTVYD